ncbi:hypothetical protein AB1Y20_008996 [Prymnesium parvum]|uniref:Uncharacterized protein n=1 Tax=Prymnesium parvum TaxID=97485 RepID=A0AB34K0C9_PRYPA
MLGYELDWRSELDAHALQEGHTVQVDAKSLQHTAALAEGMRPRIKLQAYLVQQQALVGALSDEVFAAEAFSTPKLRALLSSIAHFEEQITQSSLFVREKMRTGRSLDELRGMHRDPLFNSSKHVVRKIDLASLPLSSPQDISEQSQLRRQLQSAAHASCREAPPTTTSWHTPHAPMIAPEYVQPALGGRDPELLDAIRSLQSQLQALQELTKLNSDQLQELKEQRSFAGPSASNSPATGASPVAPARTEPGSAALARARARSANISAEQPTLKPSLPESDKAAHPSNEHAHKMSYKI